MENEKNEMQEQKELIRSEVENFAKAHYDVLRLRLIGNASHLIGSLLLTLCIILLSFAVLSFCAAAAVVALSICLPVWAACLIVGAFYLLLIFVLAACSKVLFVNPIVRKLSGLKNSEELKYELLRAEGRAAVQRERVTGRLQLLRSLYSYYSKVAQTAWAAIARLFKK